MTAVIMSRVKAIMFSFSSFDILLVISILFWLSAVTVAYDLGLFVVGGRDCFASWNLGHP